MSHYIDYDDPEVWGMVRKSHCMNDKPSVQELQKQLALDVGDAGVWAEAEEGGGEDDLELMFGFVIGDDDPDGAIGITEFDRHRRLAEFHMSAAMMHKKLGEGSTFDENEAAIKQMNAADKAREKIDRRAAVLATRAKSSN